MTTLSPAPVSYQQLTWLPAERKFIAEASDLKGFGRVYDDAVDEGFTIIGKTGRAVVLVVDHEEIDAEGDLLWWDLTPANNSDRAVTAGAKIFND